ncbi:hypothetical protein FRC08_016140 [Ceratobasidium sp. 394]|nr:hypothetical protein FRC08_016140 [Ceratobasidium sp. 394]
MLRGELQTAERFLDHPLRDYVTNALGAKDELCDQRDAYYRADKLPFRYSHPDNMTAAQYWRLQKEFRQTFILAKLFSVLANSMCDECAGSRLTHLYSKLRNRLDARSMVGQIQFRQWGVLAHATGPVTQPEKAQRMRRFKDIPPAGLPNNQPSEDSVEMSAALPDGDVGDDWLDAPTTPHISKDSLVQHVALFGESDIDLTSHMLVNDLSINPVLEAIKLEDGGNRSPESLSQSSLLPVTRVGDVQWE